MLKHICIINTGGTITMQPSDQGFKPDESPVEYYYKNATKLFPKEEVPSIDVITLSPVIDSANMNPSHWNRLAETIMAHYHEYDGFVILHGTDTMAYTGSALSFILQNLDKPVILTGALLPITNVLTDAWENMRLSVLLAAKAEILDVCIFFHRQLFRANRATKIKSNGYGAFVSPNYPVLAAVMSSIEFDVNAMSQQPKKKNALQLIQQTPKIAVIYFYPGISADVVLNAAKDMDAIILKTFGSGNAPVGDESIKASIKTICDACPIVINHLQCVYGEVKGAYETSQALINLGVVSSHDMTIEAVIAKLYYLFTVYESDADQIREKFSMNLIGELS